MECVQVEPNSLKMRVDEETMKFVTNFGFDKEQLMKDLELRIQTRATVAYYLQLDDQAQQSQNNVAKVASSNRQPASTYGAPSQPRISEVPVKVQNFIENLYRATSQKRADSGNALKSNADAPPVINTQGQATGRILNLAV